MAPSDPSSPTPNGGRLRLQIAAGVAAVVVVAVVLIVVLGGGSGDDDGPSAAADTATGPSVTLPGPGPLATDVYGASKAAGCTLTDPKEEGSTHVPDSETVDYKTNPPSSGNHHQVPAQDGIYPAGDEPAPEEWVHTLEHGRIIVQYRKGTDAATVSQLEQLVSEPFNGTPGYHAVLMENGTAMPYAVAAVAWTHILGCKTVDAKSFDAIRAFRSRYTDKAPELVP